MTDPTLRTLRAEPALATLRTDPTLARDITLRMVRKLMNENMLIKERTENPFIRRVFADGITPVLAELVRDDDTVGVSIAAVTVRTLLISVRIPRLVEVGIFSFF